jgi:WD40 repeat protein
MRRIRYLILLSVLFQLVGCSNINDIKEQEPAISMLPTHEPQYTASAGTSEPTVEPYVTPTDNSGNIRAEPTENTTSETPNNTWPPDKPDYLVNMDNYDLADEKEKYLLRVELFRGGDYDYPTGMRYFIDVDEIHNIDGYYEIYDSSIIPKELQQDVLRISEDGQKALLVYKYAPEGQDNVVEVFDITNHEVIYQYKTQYQYLEDICISSSPNLDYLLLPSIDDYSVFVDVNNNKETKISTTPRGIISPDGAKTAIIDLSEASFRLKIYNLFSGELLDEVDIGKENAYLTQWNETGKILYYTFDGSFYYDLNTKEIVSLGSYFYGPVMSPDGKYVAYCRSEDVGPFFPLHENKHWLYKEYGYNEGLFIKDMATGELIQIAPIYAGEYGSYHMAPLQWVYVNKTFDNQANRCCFQTDSGTKYVAYSSSMKKNYGSDNIIDKNVGTAWAEGVYYFYDELDIEEYEDGIGEWVKIYKLAQANIEFSQYETRSGI